MFMWTCSTTDGRVLNSADKRIGLRTLKLLAKMTEIPSGLRQTAFRFFAKGANWIPADSFRHACHFRKTPALCGGCRSGQHETCSAFGAAVITKRMRSLMPATKWASASGWTSSSPCASYPSFDANFMENVRQEASDNLRRLAHHPCIAVWCGQQRNYFPGPGQMGDQHHVTRGL